MTISPTFTPKFGYTVTVNTSCKGKEFAYAVRALADSHANGPGNTVTTVTDLHHDNSIGSVVLKTSFDGGADAFAETAKQLGLDVKRTR